MSGADTTPTQTFHSASLYRATHQYFGTVHGGEGELLLGDYTRSTAMLLRLIAIGASPLLFPSSLAELKNQA